MPISSYACKNMNVTRPPQSETILPLRISHQGIVQARGHGHTWIRPRRRWHTLSTIWRSHGHAHCRGPILDPHGHQVVALARFMVYIQQQISLFTTRASVHMSAQPWFRHLYAGCRPLTPPHSHFTPSPSSAPSTSPITSPSDLAN